MVLVAGRFMGFLPRSIVRLEALFARPP